MSPFSDISQNSILEKQILHKIQYQKNRLFAKFITRKTDSSQNFVSEKQILHKIKKESQGQENSALKNSWFSGNFCFYETKLPISKKFADFHVMLNNFLVSMAIIVFQFYQELNAVQSEDSERKLKISKICQFWAK